MAPTGGGGGKPLRIQAFSDRTSIRDQLREVHENLKSELPLVTRVAVALYDDQTDTLKTFVHSTDADTAPFSHYEAKLAQMPSLHDLARGGCARIIDDLGSWTAASDPLRRLIERAFRSTYTVPFYDQGRFFGFLFFDAKEPGYFSAASIRHLSVYANLLSLLIMNEISRASALRSAILVARKMSHSHNEETGAHLDRMARYAQLIARTIASSSESNEIDDEFVEFVFLYAPLHDVGKIAVPDRILLKPGRLSIDEFEIMKTHVTAGMEIVESIARSFRITAGQHVDLLRNIVRYHHETMDGGGYPSGCRGPQIPLEARIVAVADVFDALTSERCYKQAWTNDAAFQLLRERAGRSFDPLCVDALIGNAEQLQGIQARFRSNNGFHEGYTDEL